MKGKLCIAVAVCLSLFAVPTIVADTLGFALDTSGGGGQHVDSVIETPGNTGDYFGQEFTLTNAIDLTSVSVEASISSESPFTIWLLSGAVGSGTPANVLESATFSCCSGPGTISLTNPLTLSAGVYQIVVSGSGGCCGTRVYNADPLLGAPAALPLPTWGTIGQAFECTTDASGFCDTAFAPGGSWQPLLVGGATIHPAYLDFQVQGTAASTSVPEPSSMSFMFWLPALAVFKSFASHFAKKE